MFDLDTANWAPTTWALYALAAVYVVAFLVFWFRLDALERRAKREGGDAVHRYNAALRGFPNAVFAKMFGKRGFEVARPNPAEPGEADEASVARLDSR